MDQLKSDRIMDEIYASMKQAGYDPYEQLVGYLQTGKDYYITRQNNAREKIRTVDKDIVRRYIIMLQDTTLR